MYTAKSEVLFHGVMIFILTSFVKNLSCDITMPTENLDAHGINAKLS